MIAEPLDQGIAEDIEAGRVKIEDPVAEGGRFLRRELRLGQACISIDMGIWARKIWVQIFCRTDTLPSKVDKKSLNTVKESIKQGFSWGTREGPLCEEPIRNTKFKLTDVSLAPEAIYRGGGQIIPAARRAIYSSFLMAAHG